MSAHPIPQSLDYRKMVHATCVEMDAHGILLRGASGSGKSDLALRLIDQGAALVADDQVSIRVCGDTLIASAPDNLRGKFEVRGMGIVQHEYRDSTTLELLVDLTEQEAPRMPDRFHELFYSVRLPRIALNPFQESACAKLRLMLRIFAGRGEARSRMLIKNRYEDDG